MVCQVRIIEALCFFVFLVYELIIGTKINNQMRKLRVIVISVTFFLFLMGCTKQGGNWFDRTPKGAINGIFTANGHGDQVYFSQGNLQYQASTNTWRFAENQMDYVGGIYQGLEFGNVYENGIKCNNELKSSTYEGWIDLFGWATSGWDNNNHLYHPWYDGVAGSGAEGLGYGYWDGETANYSMTGDQANCDWGVYNAISNGGNKPGLWRTLCSDEWDYILNKRRTTSGIRYAKAMVDEVNGLILLPDDWDPDWYRLDQTNDSECDYGVNSIVPRDWQLLEKHGAVFLPAAGVETMHQYYNTRFLPQKEVAGYYWSSTTSLMAINGVTIYCAKCLNFMYDTNTSNNNIVEINTVWRVECSSVRLVCSAN